MDGAATIREALGRVAELRAAVNGQPDLSAALTAVKQLQSRRFRRTYPDLLASPPHAGAARFFLEELYGPRDYTARDAQFARIAGSVASVFPEHVVHVAVRLAGLHALTEELDLGLAHAWLQLGDLGEARRYLFAWRQVGNRSARRSQLDEVIALGLSLGQLTRAPGLRLMLRMMRKPAGAAGLGALQEFLEVGFDTFGEMNRTSGALTSFLDCLEVRESSLMDALFDGPLVASETKLAALLGQAP